MKKKRKIGTQKSAIKKVAQSGSQGIEKHTIANTERGITLIALVVTIIIMLILAGVALSMALGDNGLIQMAKLATDKYEEAALNESKAMNELVKGLGGGSGSNPTTPTETPEGGGGENSSGEQKTASDLTKDNYGDYVDYGLDLSGDGDTTNDWKIFYVGDESNGEANDRIFLIAADYVPNTCSALIEATSTAHTNMIASTEPGYVACCRWFNNSSLPTYHCYDDHNKNLNNFKEQCSFPEIFMPDSEFCSSEYHYYCSDHVGTDGTEGKDSARCASALQCTGNWKSFIDQSTKKDCADYAIGGPTVELWIASWNKKHGEIAEADGNQGKNLYAIGKDEGYIVGNSMEYTNQFYVLSSTKGYNDTLYFPHKEYQNFDLFGDFKPNKNPPGVSDNACSIGYYLSSPRAVNYEYPQLLCVNFNGWISQEDSGLQAGLRPIVCLKSNVKLITRSTSNGRTVYDISMQ